MGSSGVSSRVNLPFRLVFSACCRRVIMSTLLEVEGAVVERFALDTAGKRNDIALPLPSPKRKENE